MMETDDEVTKAKTIDEYFILAVAHLRLSPLSISELQLTCYLLLEWKDAHKSITKEKTEWLDKNDKSQFDEFGLVAWGR